MGRWDGEGSPVGHTRWTWRDVMRRRLRRHHRRAPRRALLDVVADLGGLHAQLMSSAELTAWARVEGLGSDAVRRALWKDRALIKTWAMRGTLHVLPASEFWVWQGALGTHRRFTKGAWLRAFGVTLPELEQLIEAVGEALDGRELTRDELTAEVGRLTRTPKLGEKLRESWGTMLKPAAFQGRLCFAPSVGQNVRFTRPDTWLGTRSSVDPAAAQLEVTRRFLAVNGPATREDFARWWGMDPAPATAWIRALGDDVQEVDVEGVRMWMLAADAREPAGRSSPRSVRLVPAFDQYVIGATRHAEHLLPGPFRDRVYRAQGWVSPVLLVDGRMDGVWWHERKGRRLLVGVEPFVKLPPWARREVETEAERLAIFLGGTLDLMWEAPAAS